MEWIACLKDIVLMCTAITASIVAIKGLSTWKKQLKGKDEYDLCKRIIIDLYKYKEGIKIVRNPVMFSSEFNNKEDETLTNIQIKNYKNKSYAYQQRWQKIEENRNKLNLDLIESRVFWNGELEKLLLPIFDFENKLFYAVQDTLIMSNPEQDKEYKKVVGESFRQENKTEVLYFLGKDDKHNNKLERDIKEIENFIQKKLKG